MTKQVLPGDNNNNLAAMLRVDHAGEYGAQRIYAGQMAVLKNHPCHAQLQHMAAQEQVHLQEFSKLLQQNKVRPSALLPFWHVAGYALGAASAMLGPRAAMACTVAVESVISEHYGAQIAALPDEMQPLKATLQQFKAEEEEHHAIGMQNDAEQAPAYNLLTGAIRGCCKLAIKIAEKI